MSEEKGTQISQIKWGGKPTHRNILIEYSEWLEEHSYLDTDWREEPPNAVDRFLDEKATD